VCEIDTSSSELKIPPLIHRQRIKVLNCLCRRVIGDLVGEDALVWKIVPSWKWIFY
jgi:hypothetical protein